MERVSLTAVSRENTLIIKGLAILYVLLGHMGYIPWGGGAGVGLFLIISGYGINETVKAKGFDHYWAKRIKTVFVPYFFVAVFGLVAFGWERQLSLPASLIGIDFSLNRDSTMWYISFIFYWYISFFIIAGIGRRIANPMGARLFKIVGLCAMAILCQILFKLGVWHYYSFAGSYKWLFLVGVLLSEASELKLSRTKCQLFWAVIFGLSTARVLSAYPDLSERFWLSMPIQVVAVVQLTDIRGWVGSMLKWFGKYSYSLYLFEGIVITHHRNLWFAVFGNQILIDITAVAVTIVFGWIYWEAICEKLLNKIPIEKYIKI